MDERGASQNSGGYVGAPLNGGKDAKVDETRDLVAEPQVGTEPIPAPGEDIERATETFGNVGPAIGQLSKIVSLKEHLQIMGHFSEPTTNKKRKTQGDQWLLKQDTVLMEAASMLLQERYREVLQNWVKNRETTIVLFEDHVRKLECTIKYWKDERETLQRLCSELHREFEEKKKLTLSRRNK